MHASIDSTIMDIEGLTEERTKLRKIIAETIDNNTEGNNLLLRPFLLGTHLFAIYQSLVNAQNEVNRNRRSVLEHLSEIIAMQNELSGNLSDMHHDLVNVIINSELLLLQLIIDNLSDSHDLLPDIWQDCTIVEEITRALITPDKEQDTNVVTLLDSFKNLLIKLNERVLTMEFETIITNFEKLPSLHEASYKVFKETTLPLVRDLEILLEKAQLHSFENLTKNINEILEKIQACCQDFIKQDVENQMNLINNSPWVKIADKKKLYSDLIPLIELLCDKAPVLKLSEQELDVYCKQISAGFELTREACFLDLMERFAKLFYCNNDMMLQNINGYIQSEKNTVVTTSPVIKPILKRVHFSNENQIMEIEARPKKQAQYSNEPVHKKQCTIVTNQSASTNTDKFINILDPLISNTGDISRRFVAIILLHIVNSIDSLKTQKGAFKLLMKHYLLTQAKEICPENASEVYQELHEKLELLGSTSTCKTAIRDSQKFANQNNSVDLQSGTQKNPVITRFKTILRTLIEDVDACTPSDVSFDVQMQGFIDCLFIKIKEDMKQRISEKHLQKIQAPFLESNYDPVPKSIEIPFQKTVTSHSGKPGVTSLTSPKSKYVTLKDAMLHANPDDFRTYLNDLKSSMPSSNYLEFLIKKNFSNFTALHETLHTESFSKYQNVPTYLAEVKTMMFAEKKYSFQQFLVSKTATGLTFLHLVARSGNLEFLKHIIADFKCELSSDEYARALRMESNYGYYPNCPPEKITSQDIKKLLKYERADYPITTDTRNTLFHNNSEKMASTKETPFPAQPGK